MSEQPTSQANDPYDPEVARVLEGFDLRDAMIAGLAAGANDLTDAARKLVSTARLSKLEKTIAMALLAVNTVGMLLIGAATIGILVIQRSGNEQRTEIATVLNEVRSCTTPAGACAKRGNQGTANALQRILQTQVIVKECDRKLPPAQHSQAEFEACVNSRIARLSK